MNINWKQKFSSRKLWIGIALVVIGIILCATGDVTNGMRVITIGGVGYLGAECIVDVARAVWPSSSEATTEATEETTYTVELTDDEANERAMIEELAVAEQAEVHACLTENEVSAE